MSKYIVYIAPGMSSFVAQDIEFLSKKHKVRGLSYSISDKYEVLYKSPILFFTLLFSRVDVFLVSFGGYHSLIAALVARMRRRPIYIILNGTDSVSIPEYNYGHLRKGLLKLACLQSYHMADKLLPVSDSLIYTANRFAFKEKKELGLRQVDDQLVEKCEVIHNGFDENKWEIDDSISRIPNRLITVAGGMQVASLKGLDLIFEVAGQASEYEFVVVGMEKPELDLPSNIVFKGRMSPQELAKEYNQSSYYLQLSVWEGFGCALCEAMMCGCIPIVSEVNMLPEIAGENGIVLKKRESDALLQLIRELPERVEKDRQILRKDILTRFSIGDRIRKLENLFY
jgi:glycosyltransferase involved in cell wall biosynthesis